MKVSIVSTDGTPQNTKIVDADTGKELKYVKSFRLEMKAHEPTRAILEVLLPPVDLTGVEAMIVDLLDIIESCDFTCLAGSLAGSNDWQTLKALIRKEVNK